MRTVPSGVAPAAVRKLISILGVAILLIGGSYTAARYILAGDVSALSLLALGFVGLAFMIAMLNNWQRGLYIFLAWLVFEDFARKYLGNNMGIYFAKDVLVAVVYLSFFLAWRRRETPGFRPPFIVPLLLMVWFAVIQVFNPASPHLIFGVLGMKLFFSYVPLMFVGYALLDSEIQLRRFFFVNLTLMILITGLGIVQSIIGPTFLNPATLQEDIRELSTLYRVAPISGAIVYRPTSVFVSTGRYVDFLNVSWFLVLGFTGYMLLRHKRGRWVAFVALSMVAGATVLSASRGVFAWGVINLAVMAVAFVWGAPWKQREAVRVLRALQRIVLGVALAVFLLFVTFPDEVLGRLALYSETMSGDNPQNELMHRAKDYPLRNLIAAFTYERWPYGYGIGTTSLGTQYVARFFGVKPPVVGVESGFGAIVVEMGVGGLILWLIMSIAILVSAWTVVVRLRGSPWFPIGFIIFWYGVVLLFPLMFGGIQAYEDFVMNAYFWLLLGVLFRLPSIKVSAEFATAANVSTPRQRRWIV